MTWREQSACRDVPTEIFYPTAGEITKGRPPNPDTRPDPYAWARAICATCPTETRFHCLKDALDTGDYYGFRAGQEPDDIAAMIRRNRGEVNRVCEWCGGPYTAGPKAVTRKYCGQLCVKAAQREASWQYKLRQKQRARGGGTTNHYQERLERNQR